MKLIIAGGRDYEFKSADYTQLDNLRRSRSIDEVVSGGATGADECGARWAKSRGIPVHPAFKAYWNDLTRPDAIIKTTRNGRKYDAYAGPRRNKEMDRAFGDSPWRLKAEHVPILKGMSASYRGVLQNPYKRLIEAIDELDEIIVWEERRKR